ncbi:ubiquinone/menaquinone biosynthesis C-methylase UbiE [Flavobacterium sp. W4I14]|nr:ubiquinone/menaquinone biosynthesis C-methylase UbiE [Flavobacterium sp. W4I14]
MNKKNWTGERLETHIFNENMAEHLHRYAIAQKLVYNKNVLDIACGEGYGSNLLAKNALNVIGVDIDKETVQAATNKYKTSNLSFRFGKADEIPLDDNSVDVVVSFETIEHHTKHDEMLKEIKRVLRMDGILVISSPDKKHYTDETGYINEFHVKELYQDEFQNLIHKYFSKCSAYNQRFISGSFIESVNLNGKQNFFTGDYLNIISVPFTPVYNLIIASDTDVPPISSTFFLATDRSEQIRKEAFQSYQNTITWKTGRFFLYPFSMLKRLFKREA